MTKPGIRRLCRRGGVKRISKPVYEESRGEGDAWMIAVLKDALLFAKHTKRKTISVADMVHAINRHGNNLYGFGTDGAPAAKKPLTQNERDRRAAAKAAKAAKAQAPDDIDPADVADAFPPARYETFRPGDNGEALIAQEIKLATKFCSKTEAYEASQIKNLSSTSPVRDYPGELGWSTTRAYQGDEFVGFATWRVFDPKTIQRVDQFWPPLQEDDLKKFPYLGGVEESNLKLCSGEIVEIGLTCVKKGPILEITWTDLADVVLAESGCSHLLFTATKNASRGWKKKGAILESDVSIVMSRSGGGGRRAETRKLPSVGVGTGDSTSWCFIGKDTMEELRTSLEKKRGQ